MQPQALCFPPFLLPCTFFPGHQSDITEPENLRFFGLPTEVLFSQWNYFKMFVSYSYNLYLNNGDCAEMFSPKGLSVKCRERRKNGEEAGESPSGRIRQGRRQHGKGSRNTRSTWPTAKSSFGGPRLTQQLHCSGHTSSLWLRLTGLCTETRSSCICKQCTQDRIQSYMTILLQNQYVHS